MRAHYLHVDEDATFPLCLKIAATLFYAIIMPKTWTLEPQQTLGVRLPLS